MPARVNALRDGESVLVAPTVGRWRPRVGPGRILERGVVLGELVRLGRLVEVVVPEGVAAQVREVTPGPRDVACGEVLVVLGEAAGPVVAAGAAAPPEGVAVRAALSGTLYLRPAPDAPPFVEPGSRVPAHETIALLEVMKTFTPVQAPLAGRLVRWALPEGAEVEEGAVLAWIEPAGAKV